MKRFTVNGKQYDAKPFDFNLVCDLEDMGVSLQEMGRKHFSVTRAYFSLCAGLSIGEAGKELEAHAIAGGTFVEINAALNDEMEKSDFFRTLIKTEEAETVENQDEQEQVEAK